MLKDDNIVLPAHYRAINKASQEIEFSMPSDLKTGSLLRTLCAAKPNGTFLEIGTGTGLSLTWIAEGANTGSTITSIDNNAEFQQIARDIYHADKRISMICIDGLEWIKSQNEEAYDLIFADAWPGKFEGLEKTLSLVKLGGFYLIDDLLPQPNWWEGHQLNVDTLVEFLEKNGDFLHTTFNWSTGLMLLTRVR